MQSSNTDDRSLSAESLEVDESSSLNHGEEQVREAPSEIDQPNRKQNQEDRIERIETKIDSLQSDVQKIRDSFNEGVDQRIGRLERHLLQLKKRLTGQELDPDNMTHEYKQLYDTIYRQGRVTKRETASILNITPRRAIDKMQQIASKLDDIDFVHNNERGGNQPSILKPNGSKKDREAAKEEFDRVAAGIMGGSQ